MEDARDVVRLEVREDGCIDFRDIQYISEKVRWWLAVLRGLDPKYRYKREFVRTERDRKGRRIPRITPVRLRPYEGEIIELRGGSWSNPNRRSYWRIVRVGDDYVELEPLSVGEVDRILAEREAGASRTTH